MTAAVQSTVIGIAGIAGTVAMGTLGLYYTARGRTAPMRQILYTRQMELAVKTFRNVGRARIYVTLLGFENAYQARARKRIRIVCKRFALLNDEAAIVFPPELYELMREIENTVLYLLSEFDRGQDIELNSVLLVKQAARMGIAFRAFIGVDELSDESIKLYSSLEHLTDIAEMDLSISPHPKRSN